MKKRIMILTLLIITLVAAFTYMFIEPYLVQVTPYREVNKDIPEAFNGTKIVFVSDIHHSKDLSLNRVNALVKRINDMKPDMILLGGDYANRIAYSEKCIEALDELKAPMGVYGVLGNHDHWAGVVKVKEFFSKTNIKLLDNSSLWLEKGDARIKLGGAGDFWTDKQDINKTIHDVNEKDYAILLCHNPDFVEQIRTNKVDLVLSGHNHGGQVTFFGLWAKTSSKYGMKYRTGIVETEYTKVLVSNGIGTVFYPMRFWAWPEINVITLSNR
ncbi:MAG: metallophosphoesterase [Clostridia bacterium]|nr:metallophosphoesterase [Clostridia bacterium]